MLALQVGIIIMVPDSMGLYFPTSLQLLRTTTLSLHQSDLLLALDFLITPHPSPPKNSSQRLTQQRHHTDSQFASKTSLFLSLSFLIYHPLLLSCTTRYLTIKISLIHRFLYVYKTHHSKQATRGLLIHPHMYHHVVKLLRRITHQNSPVSDSSWLLNALMQSQCW